MEKLNFDQLRQDKIYRLLHGGEKDHGYDYVKHWNYVNNTYILHNISKHRDSSLRSYDGLVFIEKDSKFKEYPNLEYKVEFTSKSIVVGCQSIDAFTAQRIAIDILEHFTGEEL